MKRLLDRPHHLLQVSLLCNLTCPYCTSYCGPKEPPSYVDQNMDKVVALFNDMPPAVIGVTGGEPAACASMAQCVAELPQHYFMLWTNLTLLRPWMFEDNVKLFHAAYHLQNTPDERYFANARELQAAGKRIIGKILTSPDREKQALGVYDRLMDMGIPAVLVPIEYQPYTHHHNLDFLKKVVTTHLVSTMFNGRFFRSPIESKMCAAGTQESILVMNDGQLLRCAAVPYWGLLEQQGNEIRSVTPTLDNPAFLIEPQQCLSTSGCWCEPNHYGLTARANENARIEHYLETGEWRRPSGQELLDFLLLSGWNAAMAASLMES